MYTRLSLVPSPEWALHITVYRVLRITCHTRARDGGACDVAFFVIMCASLVPKPHPQEEERVWYLMSEFLVVLTQHVRKTNNPIRLLD